MVGIATTNQFLAESLSLPHLSAYGRKERPRIKLLITMIYGNVSPENHLLSKGLNSRYILVHCQSV
jgi:hypothetical protein